jgi:integrase
LLVTAAFTGLRQGELRELLWQHVDFDASRVRAFENSYAIGTLRPRWYAASAPRPRTACGIGVDSSARFGLCRSAHRRPIARTPMMRRYRAALAVAGLDVGFRFHDLLHTFGTSMARAGEPITTIQA